MDWRVKGTIQKILGALPGGHGLHFHLQRRFGGLRDFDGELATKVDDWEIMVGHLRDAGAHRAGADDANHHAAVEGLVGHPILTVRAHRPRNRGARFSMKAATPSR